MKNFLIGALAGALFVASMPAVSQIGVAIAAGAAEDAAQAMERLQRLEKHLGLDCGKRRLVKEGKGFFEPNVYEKYCEKTGKQ